MGAIYKYTDRDVREGGEQLYQRVEDYLTYYEGEFAFLIDCKMRLAQGQGLHIGMVRGVLNCMRVDPRVRNLPDPMGPTEDAEVIEMRPKKKEYKLRECDIEDFHGPHGHYSHSILTKIEFNEDPCRHCEGKYAINRVEAIWVPATIKRPYMISRSSNLVHKLDGEAGYNYYPERHAWGWLFDPVLRAKSLCTFPRWINTPVLLTPEEASYAVHDKPDFLNTYRMSASRKPIEFCKRCFD